MKSLREFSVRHFSRMAIRRPNFIATWFSLTVLCVLPCSQSLLATVQGQTEWVKQRSGTFAWLHALYFVDENRGWAVGGKGALLSTSDGGLTWQGRPAPVEDTLRDIVFTDSQTGWIVCERSIYKLRTKEEPRSYLLRSDDAGEAWSRVEITGLDPNAVLTRLAFADPLHGWVMGEAGLLYATSDGGKSWLRQSVPTRHLLLCGYFIDARRGWIAGAGSTLLLTSDGGTTWRSSRIEESPQMLSTASSSTAQSQPAVKTVRFNGLSFADARRGWAVGGDGAVYVTSDGGNTWRTQQAGVKADLFDVKFVDSREGFAVGAGGTIIRTEDGGATWKTIRNNTPHQLERLFLSGNSRGWAVGFGGTIVARTNPGPVVRNE